MDVENHNYSDDTMADKRKSTSRSVKRAAPPADYPRKRVSIACAVCRTRRSKCDARKPSCSKCLEIGVECEYRQPGLWDRTSASATQTSIEKFDARLSRIEDAVGQLSSAISLLIPPQDTFSGVSHSNVHLVYDNPLPPIQSPPRWVSSPVTAYQLRRARGHRMPNLLTFCAPSPLESFSYDDAQIFFGREVDQGDDSFNHLDNPLKPTFDLDLSRRTCWRLQRSFIRNFLRWIPIFDDETCLNHIQTAASCDHDEKSPDVCITLLMYAIGAVSENDEFYHRDLNSLPGYAYILKAYKILDEVRFPAREVIYLQCRVLLSAYMSFSMRPVQAWNAISQVSRDLILFLKTDWRRNKDEISISLIERIFWASYIMENELEICLELQTSSIHSVHEELPLPISPYEEEGMYFFLALASHRKLLVQVTDTIGFKSGAAYYLPIMATELRRELDDWYDHLPAPLKFPRDTTTLFDIRKAHLRGQYFAIIIIMYWPFVLRYLQSTPSLLTGEPFDQNEKLQVRERVKECLDCCCIFLKVTQIILMEKTFCANCNLRGTYAFTMILILAGQPIFESLELPNYSDLVTRSIRTLTEWQDVPFMQEPLVRIRKFASQSRGILK